MKHLMSLMCLTMASAAWAITYPSDHVPWGETPLTGTSASYTFSNAGFTSYPDEPFSGWWHPAWFSWRAPSNGKVWFSTSGSKIETVLFVLSGSSDDYNIDAFDYNKQSGGSSYCTLSVTAGTTYLICVAGYHDNQSGNITFALAYEGSTTPSYTVWFGAGAHGKRTGGGMMKQTVAQGGYATSPTITPNPGYEFIGWDKALGPINEHNYTLTAQYRAKDCGVTFNVGSKGKRVGGGAAKQTIPFGGSVANPPTVKGYEGWKALGWDNNINCITRSMTATEQYDIPVCAATFVNDNTKGRHMGGGAMKQSVGYGSSPVPPGIKPYPGHTFRGWSPAIGAMTKSQTYTALYD